MKNNNENITDDKFEQIMNFIENVMNLKLYTYQKDMLKYMLKNYKPDGWHYKHAEKIVDALPEWKREIYNKISESKNTIDISKDEDLESLRKRVKDSLNK